MVAQRLQAGGPERAVIRVGVRVFIAYAGRTREPTFPAQVRAVAADSIRVDLYSLPTWRLPPQPGEPVILIVQHGDERRALDAHAIAIDSAPPTLVLTPPIEARRAERRRFARVNLDVPMLTAAYLDPVRGAHPLNASRLVDISLGGMRFRAHAEPPAGVEVHTQLRLVPQEVAEVAGRVVGVNRVPDADEFDVRVEFTFVDPQTYATIVRIVNDSLNRLPR